MEIKRYGEKEFLSADKLYIRENEIHIWCIRWSEMTDFWKNHEYILSGQELEQAGRFRFPEDRMRYIAGKVVVRILLKRYLDMETIDFSVNELGKPYHKKIAGKRTVDFNISHSGEFILAVFAVGMDIGVDVQEIIAFSEMASLCITKASELLGENIIINRIFLINPSKAKESDLYLGDISIIDGNSVAIKSWEKAVLGNVREFESNSNDIFDIIMRELENDK